MGGTLDYADLLYGSGLRSGFANGDHLPDYHPFNLGAEHAFSSSEGHGWKVRVDVVNLFDEVYALRDGSGIGVGAPQYGARRAVFGSASFGF